MNIQGFQKLTLLDYPGHIAATIFLGGCNLRCPFCHNASLVSRSDAQPAIPLEDVLTTLTKRRHILEGVCITGGEPTLYPGLTNLIWQIKALGLKIKLDTNGTNPDLLKACVQDGLIDYVAMDIKNSREKYALTCGIPNLNLDKIEQSILFLLSGNLDYEFRTTIVKEFHTQEDMHSIGKWIEGARTYFLQSFLDSGDVLESGLNPHTKETLEAYAAVLRNYVSQVSPRGVD